MIKDSFIRRNWYQLIRARVVGLIFCMFLCGCARQHKVEMVLQQAESLLLAHPDSSLSLLSEIDSSSIRTERNRASYALLYTQAQDLCHKGAIDSLLIARATVYFEANHEKSLAFLSHYYYGRAFLNGSDYLQSMLHFFLARRNIESAPSDNYAGALYFYMGQAFLAHCDFTSSCSSYSSAYEYYSVAGNLPRMAESSFQAGILFMLLREYSKSEEWHARSLRHAMQCGDMQLQQKSLAGLALSLSEAHRYNEAKVVLDTLRTSFCIDDLGPIGLSLCSYSFALSQQSDSAIVYNQNAWKKVNSRMDSLLVHIQTARTMRALHKESEAIYHLGTAMAMQEENYRHALEHSIMSSVREYDRDITLQYARKWQESRILLYLAVFVLVLIVTLSLLLRREYIKNHQFQMNEFVAEINALKVHLLDREVSLLEKGKEWTHLEKRIQEMTEALSCLFGRQYATLDKFCITYYDTIYSGKSQEALLARVKKEIVQFGRSGETLRELEKIVNQYKNNVIGHIRSEMPQFNERDIALLCYIYSGFSAKSISIFTQQQPGNILTRKHRLRKAIEAKNPPHRQIMLGEMP